MFIDDYSRYTRVYLLSSKDEAENMFIKFKTEVENQKNKKVKRLRSDRGGEYGFALLKKFCEENGIVHEVTAPRIPEQNGIAERKNRTLKDMMNVMLISSSLPSNIWVEVILSACHVLNRVPHKKIRKTPYELWEGRAPNLGYFKVWGCLAKVGIPEPHKKKIGPKTKDSVFIGYAQNNPACRCLVLETNNIVEIRDADFFEHIFPMKRTRLIDESSSIIPQVRSSSNLDECHSTHELRCSKIPKNRTNFGPEFIIAFLIEDDLRTYQEAMKLVDATFWKEAIHSELESIMAKHTWELVELPRKCMTIGCKWVFKKKLKVDGTIDKFKARLVAKEYTQKEEINYFDIYSPVTRLSTIRILIVMASIHKLIVHQMDVNTAFLNGDLDEEIYMTNQRVLWFKDKKVKCVNLENHYMV